MKWVRSKPLPELDQAPSAFWQAVRANHKLQHQTPAITPGPRNGTLPLTLGQERLWRIEQIQPGATAHNLRAVWRLRGHLDLTTLERSLHEIVRRHEILRTCFPAVAGQPTQVIASDLTLALPEVDLTGIPQPEQAAEVQRLAAVAAQQPFDLAHGPLLRFQLLRLADDELILIRTIHHIINDRWSDSVFISELAALYPAFVRGEPSPLPDLPIQYADVALFQRRWFQGEVLTAQLDYWRQQLGGTLTPLELPVAANSPADSGYQGSTDYLNITPELTAALKRLAHQSGVSLFVVLLAACKTLLYQYSGQEDLTLCVPVAGRNRAETRTLIGYFNNLVLIRSSLSNNPSFRELIRRVSQATVGAFEHQALPLQQIAESLNIPGSMLTRAMFALQNVPSPPTAMAGISITPLDLPEGISNFDLSLSMKMQNDHLLGVLRYKTDLFPAATITRLLERFQALLGELVANPDRRLAELPRFSTETGPAGITPAAAADSYVAPQTELEQTVAAIWQTVLRREQISVEANFFAIGGRSLDLVQVGGKLQEALDLEVPLGELFNRPTIRLLADYLSRQCAATRSFARQTHDRTRSQRDALKRRQEQMQRRRKSNG